MTDVEKLISVPPGRSRLAVDRMALAQRAGQIRPEVDLESLVDQLRGACHHRLLMPAEPLSTEFADRLIANLFRGIGPSADTGDGAA